MPLKVLAVDNEPQVLGLLRSMMTTAGCVVQTCRDSRRAAETIVRNRFDAILVEASMPHLDGFTLTRVTRSSVPNHNTPVVMLTCFDDVETLDKGFRAGITFFLGKPFSEERLNRLFRVLASAGWREKRRSTRLPLRTPVHWRAGEKRSTCTSVDLSYDGMLLENTVGLRLGNKVDLTFNLPKVPSPLNMHARVMRQEAGGNVVVRFFSPRPADQEAIRRYLSSSTKI